MSAALETEIVIAGSGISGIRSLEGAFISGCILTAGRGML